MNTLMSETALWYAQYPSSDAPRTRGIRCGALETLPEDTVHFFLSSVAQEIKKKVDEPRKPRTVTSLLCHPTL